MAQVFISYRRQESAYAAGRIYDRLIQRLAQHRIFMDIDSIEPGVDFREHIDAAIGAADVVVALIGPGWLYATDGKGARRLDNPNDSVRLEIATALRRDLRLIPLFIDGAAMPAAEDLPTEIQALANRNGMEIRHARFESDVGHLVEALEAILDKKPEIAQVPAARAQPEPSVSKPVGAPDLPPKIAVAAPLPVSSETRAPAPPARRRWTGLLAAAGAAGTLLAFWYGRTVHEPDKAPQVSSSEAQPMPPTAERKDSSHGGLQPSSKEKEPAPIAPAEEVAAQPYPDSGGGHGKRPRSRLAPPSAEPNPIEALLNQKERDIVAACLRLVANDPKMIGEVAVEVSVDARGKVKQVRLRDKDTKSPLESNPVKDCVLRQIKQLTIKPPARPLAPVKRIFRFPG